MFRSVFSSKYITAIISDSADSLYLVPIIHTIGNYFVTEIKGTRYIFKIGKPKQYQGFRKNVFSLLFYDTSHFKPLNSKTSELELVLKQNSLPKVDSTLAKVFKFLGSKEKKDFKPHNIEEMVKELSELKENKKAQSELIQQGYNFDDNLANIINYLQSLNVTEIVTPLRSISDFIQEELITTDPAFMGTVIDSYQRTDAQHKIMSNTPTLGKISMMKVLVLVTLIVASTMIAYLMYSEGMFDASNNPLSSMMPDAMTKNLPFDASNDAMVQDRYPDPVSLQNAIDSGEVNPDDLSKDVKKMLEGLEQ